MIVQGQPVFQVNHRSVVVRAVLCGNALFSEARTGVDVGLDREGETEQTTTNQRRVLHAVAKRHGWSVVQVFEDTGISGAKGRNDRPC